MRRMLTLPAMAMTRTRLHSFSPASRLLFIVRLSHSLSSSFFPDCSSASHAELAATLARQRVMRSTETIEVFKQLDRRHFVPPSSLSSSSSLLYLDRSYPIGQAATLSAPFAHADTMEKMREHVNKYKTQLEQRTNDGGAPLATYSILDIGSGSGFLTVAAALLAGRVLGAAAKVRATGVEHSNILVKQSIENVKRAGFSRLLDDSPSSLCSLSLLCGSGLSAGAHEGQYQFINVGASATELSATLLRQIADDGEMLVPLMRANGEQWLCRVTRRAEARGAAAHELQHYAIEQLHVCSYAPLREKPPAEDMDDLSAFISATRVLELDLSSLEAALKAWRQQFIDTHGKTPSLQDIKKDDKAAKIVEDCHKIRLDVARRQRTIAAAGGPAK